MIKKIIIYGLVLAIGLGIGWFARQAKYEIGSIEPTLPTNKGEEFEPFFWKFMTDSTFQVSRVKFPFKLVKGINGSTDIDSALFEKANWRHIPFYAADEYKAALYDNFNDTLTNTNERVFKWEGVENGINVGYYFKRTDNQWMMIRKEDWSN